MGSAFNGTWRHLRPVRLLRGVESALTRRSRLPVLAAATMPVAASAVLLAQLEPGVAPRGYGRIYIAAVRTDRVQSHDTR